MEDDSLMRPDQGLTTRDYGNEASACTYTDIIICMGIIFGGASYTSHSTGCIQSLVPRLPFFGPGNEARCNTVLMGGVSSLESSGV